LIRVFLVTDDPFLLTTLKSALNLATGLGLAGTASTAPQALTEISLLKPDVVVSDAQLIGALRLTQQLMEQCPTPILIMSAATPDGQALSNAQLAAGAIEALPAATLSTDPEAGQLLARKLKVLAGVSVFRRKAQPQTARPALAAQLVSATPRQKILMIGASTGGPQALEAVLAKLPAHYPLPIVCIQHISKGFLDPFLLWLGGKVKLKVSVAAVGESPEPGRIYFAPDHANLELDGYGRFAYSHAPEYLHYPSVDVAFHSIAKHYGSLCIAVLLTGMGDDGAGGLKAIAQAGGQTIVQDEASCVVFGMPKAAIDNGAAQKVLNLEQIAELLCQAV